MDSSLGILELWFKKLNDDCASSFFLQQKMRFHKCLTFSSLLFFCFWIISPSKHCSVTGQTHPDKITFLHIQVNGVSSHENFHDLISRVSFSLRKTFNLYLSGHVHITRSNTLHYAYRMVVFWWGLQRMVRVQIVLFVHPTKKLFRQTLVIIQQFSHREGNGCCLLNYVCCQLCELISRSLDS